MRKFNVTVNGISYEVNVEEAGASSNSQPAPQQQAQPTSTPTPKKAPAEGVKVAAPMPGNVFKLMKKDGESVKKGEVILVLEAMKMENDIISPADGILNLSVDEGAAVSSGDLLAVIA